VEFSALQAAIFNRQGKTRDFSGFSATGLESGTKGTPLFIQKVE
jgi:hypothetical protein